MAYMDFPVIDPEATGKNIVRLRRARGLTVRDLQRFFGFEAPRAIYKWQRGESLPSVDNLYALSRILQVSMDGILVPRQANIPTSERQDDASCRPVLIIAQGGTNVIEPLVHFGLSSNSRSARDSSDRNRYIRRRF